MSRTPLLLSAVLLLSVVAGATPVAAQDTVTLTVSVVDQNDNPVGGSTIEASWDGGETTARTASNGKAFVDVPSGADVELQIDSDDYVRNSPYLVENARAEDVTVEVARQGTLTVETTSGDEPLSDVQVTLKKSGDTVVQKETGDDGTITTDVIEQGRYFLQLYKPGYYRNATYVAVNESASTTVSMVAGTTNAEFEVVDDRFDQPQQVSGAQVKIDGIGSQRTSSSGTVTFTVPVNDHYTVSATKDGYVANEKRLFIGTNQGHHTLVLNRKNTLSVEPANEKVVVGERVTVTVTNAYDDPVEGASVLVDGEEAGATDANGEIRIAIESAGEHEIVAEGNGVTSEPVTVQGIAVDDDGNTVTATESETDAIDLEALPLPGFTPAVAVLALLAGALLFTRR